MINPTSFQRRVTLGAATLMLAVTGSALSQNPIASGRILDANLNPYSGGINAAVPQQNFRARNLLITNNVIGGRGFRGTVGYTAAGDFSGDYEADDFYGFRRDSAFSSMNYINAGLTVERLNFGQDLGVYEYRRSSHGSTINELMPRTSGYDYQTSAARVASRLRLDQISSAASITEMTETQAEPISIGYSRDELGQPLSVSLSGLYGVRATPSDYDPRALGLTSYDFARFRDDVVGGRAEPTLGMSYEHSYVAMWRDRLPEPPGPEAEPSGDAAPGRIETNPMGSRIAVDDRETYDRIRQRVAERFARAETLEKTATPEEQMELLDERMQELRDRLGGGTLLEPTTTEDGETTDDEATRSVRDYAPVLRHGETITRLSTEDETRFNELVLHAEEALRDGEYYWAERRFNRALRFSPGHPLATAGLAHAQIGYGYYLSAALTLRNLYTQQPEMIDVAYDPALVPNRTRLFGAIETLRQRISVDRDRDSTGFLLAYIGRLTNDRALIEEGLGIMGESAPDDPMPELLESVWLDEEAPEDEPDGAPEK